MRRGTVEIEVVILHILAVIALAAGQTESSLFEYRVFAIPECQRKAKILMPVGNPGQSIFIPSIGF
jgi:hypothetical protein